MGTGTGNPLDGRPGRYHNQGGRRFLHKVTLLRKVSRECRGRVARRPMRERRTSYSSRTVGGGRLHQGALMPYWLMHTISVLVEFLGAALGMAGNHSLYAWWPPHLVLVALVFAGLIGVTASVKNP